MSLNVSAQQIGRVYKATEAMDGDGAVVFRLFPSKSFKHADPFILLDDFNVAPPAGFPSHQHKGFEAITYMIAGGFIHKDNIGNNDTILEGQAQRFTAARGLMHSEMPGTVGENKGLQLWLNIPYEAKKVEPTYQLVNVLPFQQKDSTRVIRVIVGEDSPLNVNCGCDLSYLDIQLKNTTLEIYPTAGYTSLIYVLQGDIKIDTAGLVAGDFYFLESGIIHDIVGGEDNRFIYLSAKPLNQPIKQRGPYVY